MKELRPLLDRLDDFHHRGILGIKACGIVKEFMLSYARMVSAGGEEADRVIPLFSLYFDFLYNLAQKPFVFEPYHKQIVSPIDYYAFGVDFFKPLISAEISKYLGEENVRKMIADLEAGENVILFANHQTEGDPQIISVLLDKMHPLFAKTMIFVAGDRVISDRLAVPFSMGRNLLCVYSKKHIRNPPEKEEAKRLHNKKTMQRMAQLLKEGGKCIYVAPSGGRDRPDVNGEFTPAPFDPQSIEMFYLMANKAGVKTRYYPLSLLTHMVLPPPNEVEAELGEERTVSYSGVYAAFGKEIDMIDFPGHIHENKIKQRHARSHFIWSRVYEDYRQLVAIQKSYEK